MRSKDFVSAFFYCNYFWSQRPEVVAIKMSRKNGKKLLIAIAVVWAVVVKALRDVRKAKKQEEELSGLLWMIFMRKN